MTDLFIGLMSGTSMDGIDAALVDFSGKRPKIVTTHSHAYTATLHRQLETALALESPLDSDLTDLDAAVGETFADASNALLTKAGVTAAHIAAIGSHGQTIRHAPDAPQPYSLQTGNAEIIANRTGIDVVADFRRADIDAGGQGAPLVPAFHHAVFASDTENRVILNIGGIANITNLTAGTATPVSGFDTGPGNTLMDAWTRQHLQKDMDTNGTWAAAGQVDQTLLANMLADPYFQGAPPKSTGREYFNPDWLTRYISPSTDANTIQTTLCELTAQSIAAAIHTHAGNASRLMVCGGGIHNSYLMDRLAANLPGLIIESTAACGVTPDWVEATAFAWLAKQYVEGKPGNIPAVTGARHPVLLGQLFRH